jgi:hypothetical protein
VIDERGRQLALLLRGISVFQFDPQTLSILRAAWLVFSLVVIAFALINARKRVLNDQFSKETVALIVGLAIASGVATICLSVGQWLGLGR